MSKQRPDSGNGKFRDNNFTDIGLFLFDTGQMTFRQAQNSAGFRLMLKKNEKRLKKVFTGGDHRPITPLTGRDDDNNNIADGEKKE